MYRGHCSAELSYVSTSEEGNIKPLELAGEHSISYGWQRSRISNKGQNWSSAGKDRVMIKRISKIIYWNWVRNLCVFLSYVIRVFLLVLWHLTRHVVINLRSAPIPYFQGFLLVLSTMTWIDNVDLVELKIVARRRKCRDLFKHLPIRTKKKHKQKPKF